MSLFPDDQPLTEFLQQHKPTVPAAAPSLEDQIVAVIEATPQELTNSPRALPPRSQVVWLTRSRLAKVSVGIAAGVVATVVGYRMLLPSQPNEAEVAELEAFIQSTWDGTVADSPTDEQILPPPDSAVN
ncbi:MAG: hypothetical protein HC866_11225 [Leptolyngbyaceae cyanobacterium RU_5_1]|nr:hypothetical protein [Leptolyngbyaceae cyanobacterium RU_5_1]